MVLIVICLLMGLKKAKDSKYSSIVAKPLCIGNISKDWGATSMKKTGLFGYVYDFSVDCGVVNFLEIVSIHK